MHDTPIQYAYCPNSQCSYLQGSLGAGAYHGTYCTLLTEEDCMGCCPYCNAYMSARCPHCNHSMRSRTSYHCPFCGGALTSPPEQGKPVCCRVCGRPMHGEVRGGVPLCSEQCVGAFISANVRVCDQCGCRFNAQDSASGCCLDFSETGQDGDHHDFCSNACLQEYLAGAVC